jgi:hypothetical protein
MQAYFNDYQVFLIMKGNVKNSIFEKDKARSHSVQIFFYCYPMVI